MLGLIARDGFVNIEPTSVEENNKQTEPLIANFTNQSVLSESAEGINVKSFLPSSLENTSEKIAVSTTLWNDFFKFAQKSTQLNSLLTDSDGAGVYANDTIQSRRIEGEHVMGATPKTTADAPQTEKSMLKSGMFISSFFKFFLQTIFADFNTYNINNC